MNQVDQKVWRWFIHMERTDEQCMANIVLKVEASCRQVQGRPRLDRMNGLRWAWVAERRHMGCAAMGKG